MEIILKLTQNVWYTVIPFILLLGVLVFVHELGHFLVARLCGVKVEVFSLGFGKKLLQYKRGDTNYCLSLIPLGGYVKMFGEQPGDTTIPEELKAVSFTHKTVLQRIAIVLAGPLMNLFFAIFVFGFVAYMGEEKRPAAVGDLNHSSEAYQSGLRPGDRILKVSGQTVKTWDDVQSQLDKKIGQNAEMEILLPNGESKSITAPVTSMENPNPLANSKVAGTITGLDYLSKSSVVAVTEGSLFSSVGLKTGDQVKTINGKDIRFWRDLESAFTEIGPGEQASLDVERLSQESEKPEILSVNFIKPDKNQLSEVGIESPELYLAHVFPNSPAQQAGLQVGDRLLTLNGNTLKDWDQVLNLIKSYDDTTGAINLTVSRLGEEKKFEILPKKTSHMTQTGKEEKRFTIGISPMLSLTTEKSVIVKADGISEALVKGSIKSYDFTVMTLLSFVRLIQGEISPKNVGGVISIGTAASESFKAGTNYFLQMMGIISISLFVLNLLPVPVLDGGHLVFYTVELIKGSPLSLKKMEMAQQVGIVLLMSLMLFALYNDFSRLLGFGTY